MSEETPEEFAKRHTIDFCVKCDYFFTAACQMLFSAYAQTGIECFKPRSSNRKVRI